MNTAPSQISQKKPVIIRLRIARPDASMIVYFVFSVLFLCLGLVFAPGNEWETAGLYTGGLLLWVPLDKMFSALRKRIERTPVLLFDRSRKLKISLPPQPGKILQPPAYGLLIAAFCFVLLFPLTGFYSVTLLAGLTNGYLFYSCISHALQKRRTQVFLSRLQTDHYYDYSARRYRRFDLSSHGWDQLLRQVPLEKDPEMQFYFLN